MAEILVSDVCARRLSAAGELFLWGIALFFSCYPLFPRRRPFSRCRRDLHCNTVPFPSCQSPVFFSGLLDSNSPRTLRRRAGVVCEQTHSHLPFLRRASLIMRKIPAGD